MKLLYSRFRILLFAFTLGLAAVYMWNGLSISRMEVQVDLPKVTSADEVLVVVPTGSPDYSQSWWNEGDRTERILDGRDLSLYDTIGFVRNCSFEEGNDLRKCLSKRDAARQFVYEHWTRQRRGYVQVGFPCTYCGPVDHIFIEPENGQWIIVTTLETNGPLSTSRSSKAVFRKPHRDDWFADGSLRILSLVYEDGQEAEAF